MNYRQNNNKFPVKRIHIQLSNNSKSNTIKPTTKAKQQTIFVKQTTIFQKPISKQKQTIKQIQTIKNLHRESIYTKPQQKLHSIKTTKLLKRTKSKSSLEAQKHETLLQQYKEKINSLKNCGIGKKLVIVACGPSVNEINLNQLSNINTIDIMCINKPDKRVWPPTYWLFCDQTQFARNKDLWEHFNGTIINASSIRARHKNQVLIKGITGKGFSTDMQKGFYIGRSSTYAALQVSLWMNYDKIYILGLDMSAVNGQLHFYGINPDVPNETRIQRFAKEAENFDYGVEHMKQTEKDKIVILSNYNPYDFTNKFKKYDHTQAIDVILNKT
jgi:hypothetical protein